MNGFVSGGFVKPFEAVPTDHVPAWQETTFGKWFRRRVYDLALWHIGRRLEKHKSKAAWHFAMVRYYGEEKRRWQALERP